MVNDAPAAPAILTGKTRRPPNMVFILNDQQFGFRSFPKGLIDHLPTHQWLLARGTSLENYHVHTTPCSPSRSTIYTGQHTQQTGIYVNTDTPPQPQLPETMPTMGTLLRQAGYATSYKGKWHLSGIASKRNWNHAPGGIYPMTTDYLEAYGFSDYNFYGEPMGLTWDGFNSDPLVASDAARLLLDRGAKPADDGRPWFLVINLVNPHDIMFFDATGKQGDTRAQRYLLGPVLPAPGHPLYEEDLGFELPDSFFEDDLSTKPEAHRGSERQNNAFYGEMRRDDLASWRRFTNYYYNCLRDVDRNLATIRWALEKSGAIDNTVVVLTSDHGERAAAHGLRQKAGTMYKEEVNVPMVISHPDVSGGRTSQRLMSAIDVVPTLLGLTGVADDKKRALTQHLKGVDVSTLVANPTTTTERDRRGHLFNYAVRHAWAFGAPGPDGKPRLSLEKRRLHRGVHDGRYKFARYFAPADHHRPTDFDTLVARNDLELYDTQADPNEIVNLAADPNRHRVEIERLNAQTNALIDYEVGAVDDGAYFGGPPEQYRRGVA